MLQRKHLTPMKRILFTLLLSTAGLSNYAQIFLAKTCEISFFSATPLEDIAAVNKVSKPILNTITNDIQIKVPIISFKFEKPLMEEHFNENYMETEKYPYAIFKGKINEDIDFAADGTHKVTVSGKLNVHGIEKDRTLEGTLTKKGQQITIDTKFMINLAEHNIERPSVVMQNIAENIEVKLNATLEPYKKDEKK